MKKWLVLFIVALVVMALFIVLRGGFDVGITDLTGDPEETVAVTD